MSVSVPQSVLSASPLFPLGQIAATPGALDLLDRTSINASSLLYRHQRGDWGTVCAEHAQSNDQAISIGARIFSVYEHDSEQERLWIITEADRRVTTLLLPTEY